jgi:hypothetical protein
MRELSLTHFRAQIQHEKELEIQANYNEAKLSANSLAESLAKQAEELHHTKQLAEEYQTALTISSKKGEEILQAKSALEAQLVGKGADIEALVEQHSESISKMTESRDNIEKERLELKVYFTQFSSSSLRFNFQKEVTELNNAHKATLAALQIEHETSKKKAEEELAQTHASLLAAQKHAETVTSELVELRKVRVMLLKILCSSFRRIPRNNIIQTLNLWANLTLPM